MESARGQAFAKLPDLRKGVHQQFITRSILTASCELATSE